MKQLRDGVRDGGRGLRESARKLIAPSIQAALLAVLAGCAQSTDPTPPTPGGNAGPADPATLVLKAETTLGPGQSGFVSLAGQARGLLSTDPGAYGEHLDDQRLLYWNFDAKPATLGTRPGTPVSPIAGVQIYRDRYGVPIIYGDTVRNLWYGVGYAIAQDRLFLMDAVRRMGTGSFAELTGCGGVAADIQQRTITYSDAEYQGFFDQLSQDSKDSVLGYVDGANAWREEAIRNRLQSLPAEYTLLTTTPAPFTVKDVLAAGVFITRFVAAEGGNEMQNVRMLRALETQLGSRAAAYDAFDDMAWNEDPNAVVTVPRSEGTFSNQSTPPANRDAVFRRVADWALTLPDTLADGPGTGAAAAPFPCGQPSLPGPLGAAGRDGETAVKWQPGNIAAPQAKVSSHAKQASAMFADRAQQVARLIRTTLRSLYEFRQHLHGGSFAVALAPNRTRDRGTLLISGPQLGYGYPELLVEYEIHGPNGYNARGSSVPILPVVGIGYTENTAWGLTTGYSKTIDSFIETICSTSQIAAGTCTRNQYRHQNQWKAMSCRSERIPYRAAANGIPVGPAILSQTVEICRTVHGPVVARDDTAGLARSVQYGMFQRETQTLEGIREWNRARNLDEFRAAVATVTWNENVTVATRDGHIAYWHPGLHIRRHPETDQRLPTPGTGEFDASGWLRFDEVPQVIDPEQGYLANWNNKPAYGWLDGEGLGYSSRPGGHGQRVTNLLDLVATRRDWTYADLRDIDIRAGTRDIRAREYLPALRRFRTTAAGRLDATQRAALDLVLNGWDSSHYGPAIDLQNPNATDGPAATIFGEFVFAMREELFGTFRNAVIIPGSGRDNAGRLTVFDRVSGVGGNVFDQSVMDNLITRIIDPASSGLAVRRDYTGGRSHDDVMLAALNRALTSIAMQFNNGAALTPATLDRARRIHPRSQLCSLTGVIGPGSSTLPGTACVTMPYQNRGTWVHRVGYERP